MTFNYYYTYSNDKGFNLFPQDNSYIGFIKYITASDDGHIIYYYTNSSNEETLTSIKKLYVSTDAGKTISEILVPSQTYNNNNINFFITNPSGNILYIFVSYENNNNSNIKIKNNPIPITTYTLYVKHINSSSWETIELNSDQYPKYKNLTICTNNNNIDSLYFNNINTSTNKSDLVLIQNNNVSFINNVIFDNILSLTVSKSMNVMYVIQNTSYDSKNNPNKFILYESTNLGTNFTSKILTINNIHGYDLTRIIWLYLISLITNENGTKIAFYTNDLYKNTYILYHDTSTNLLEITQFNNGLLNFYFKNNVLYAYNIDYDGNDNLNLNNIYYTTNGTTWIQVNNIPIQDNVILSDKSNVRSCYSPLIYNNAIPNPPKPIVPTSNICFPKGTKVHTDQGIICIESINTKLHTIDNNRIVALTKTTPLEHFFVHIEKDALGKNQPCCDTYMTASHKVLYNGSLCSALNLYLQDVKGVSIVIHEEKILYNILMKNHEIIKINNMRVETLHPKNMVAKLYRKLSHCKTDLIKQRKMIKKFNKIYKTLHANGI